MELPHTASSRIARRACLSPGAIVIMFLSAMMSAMDIWEYRLALSESTDKGATLQMAGNLVTG